MATISYRLNRGVSVINVYTASKPALHDSRFTLTRFYRIHSFSRVDWPRLGFATSFSQLKQLDPRALSFPNSM